MPPHYSSYFSIIAHDPTPATQPGFFISGPTMILTASKIQQAVGCSAAVAARWTEPLATSFRVFSITTPKRAAAFLAQVGHESGGLSTVVENLNYSAQGLANIWPGRYSVNPKARPLVPNQLARALERKPQAIANNTYAGRMGNGPEASGDGWRYRGRGPIQNTGKAYAAALRSPVGPPSAVAQPIPVGPGAIGRSTRERLSRAPPTLRRNA